MLGLLPTTALLLVNIFHYKQVTFVNCIYKLVDNTDTGINEVTQHLVSDRVQWVYCYYTTTFV